MGSLKPVREEDPREAILKFAQAAEGIIIFLIRCDVVEMDINCIFTENPSFFGAYKQTQPQTIFSAEDEEEEQK